MGSDCDVCKVRNLTAQRSHKGQQGQSRKGNVMGRDCDVCMLRFLARQIQGDSKVIKVICVKKMSWTVIVMFARREERSLIGIHKMAQGQVVPKISPT